jgi:hypothetical protein
MSDSITDILTLSCLSRLLNFELWLAFCGFFSFLREVNIDNNTAVLQTVVCRAYKCTAVAFFYYYCLALTLVAAAAAVAKMLFSE